MVSFLDESQLRAKLAKGFKGKVLVGTLTRESAAGSNNEFGDPVTVTSTFRVEGFNDNYNEVFRVTAGIPEGSSKVTLILGNCETDPLKDDVVKFPNWPALKIRKVNVDPAKAHAECESFEVQS